MAVFLGGANVVARQAAGQLEALLTARNPGLRLRFRSLAWEGDTVFAQPRGVNFPTIVRQLRDARATLVFLEYGQAEALAGQPDTAAFAAAYGRMLDAVSAVTPRVVLVLPPRFESAPPPLPDLGLRNEALRRRVDVIAKIGAERRLRIVDLFNAPPTAPARRLTDDGWHFSDTGHAAIARRFAEQLDPGALAGAAATDDEGRFIASEWETLRREIVGKNELWREKSRPMNWAFLGGDRTEQPSSHDHRNPAVRWFPAEMERFDPLIEQAERRIEAIAAALNPGAR